MSSLVNMLLGGALAVVIVLAFWLVVGLIDDVQHRKDAEPHARW
jgi:hypothetical protein